MADYDVVFVVLTYRNEKDVKDFFESLRSCSMSYKVIIVNAFFDEESSAKIAGVADKYGADFIEAENKGYGYGNNIGIEYAKKHYQFKYLIISNPDIEIKKFDLESLAGMEHAVIGPKIITLTGKNQNPMFYRKCTLALRLLYRGSKDGNGFYFFVGRAINKTIREIGRWLKKKEALVQIYQTHGSFVIFSADVINRFEKIYDENMFLFAEESYLSYVLQERGIKTYYCNRIEVLHKEDGSMKFRNDLSEQAKASNIYVYEKYYKFQ